MSASIYSIIFFIILQIATCPSNSNELNAQSIWEQDLKYASLNVGINGLVGGFGALANKTSDQSNWSAFKKGFTYGALGGSIIHLGKHLTNQITIRQEPGYAWLARLANAAGTSVVQNAAANLEFWERWHLNFGIIRLDYHVKNKQFQARIAPGLVAGNLIISTQGKLDVRRSLQTGVLIYQSDTNLKFLNLHAPGLAATNSIAIHENIWDNHHILAHEIMHVLQYDSYIYINPFFVKLNEKLVNDSKLYRQMSRFFYFDFNGPLLFTLAVSQYHNPWSCRYIEREAEHFSHREILPRCK